MKGYNIEIIPRVSSTLGNITNYTSMACESTKGKVSLPWRFNVAVSWTFDITVRYCTYVLGDLQDQSFTSIGNFDLEGIQNFGKLFIELNIDDGTNNSGDLTGAEGGSGGAVSTDTR